MLRTYFVMTMLIASTVLFAQSYPGTGGDFFMRIGLNGPPTFPQADTLSVTAGDAIQVDIDSPFGTNNFRQLYLVAAGYTGPPIESHVSGLWVLNGFADPIILVGPVLPVTLGQFLLPGGNTYHYELPPLLDGLHIVLQAAVIDFFAMNDIGEFSDAIELVYSSMP